MSWVRSIVSLFQVRLNLFNSTPPAGPPALCVLCVVCVWGGKCRLVVEVNPVVCPDSLLGLGTRVRWLTCEGIGSVDPGSAVHGRPCASVLVLSCLSCALIDRRPRFCVVLPSQCCFVLSSHAGSYLIFVLSCGGCSGASTPCLIFRFLTSCILPFSLQGYEPLSGKHEVLYKGDLPWEVREREGSASASARLRLFRNSGSATLGSLCYERT